MPIRPCRKSSEQQTRSKRWLSLRRITPALVLVVAASIPAGQALVALHYLIVPHYLCSHGELTHGDHGPCSSSGHSSHSHSSHSHSSQGGPPHRASSSCSHSHAPHVHSAKTSGPPTFGVDESGSHDHCSMISLTRDGAASASNDTFRRVALLSPTPISVACRLVHASGRTLYRLAPKTSPPTSRCS